jgi:hypothetical protein
VTQGMASSWQPPSAGHTGPQEAETLGETAQEKGDLTVPSVTKYSVTTPTGPWLPLSFGGSPWGLLDWCGAA